MDAEEVAAMCLTQQVFEDLVDHDVVASVPPVRWVVVNGFDAEPKATEESDEPIGAVVGPRKEYENGL